MKRSDGRSANELRPFFLKMDVDRQASGSCFFQIGATKVLAVVNGPYDNSQVSTANVNFATRASLMCSVQFAPFSSPKRIKQHTSEVISEEDAAKVRLYEALVPSLYLERFPKSAIDVHVIVLQSDGSDMAAAITASSLALADAGIHMRDFVVGAELCSNASNDFAVYLDPTSSETSYTPEKHDSTNPLATVVAPVAAPTTLLAYMPRRNKMTHISHTGSVNSHSLIEILKLGVEGALALYQEVRRQYSAYCEEKMSHLLTLEESKILSLISDIESSEKNLEALENAVADASI